MDPANPNHILSGNDGGVSETWDGGKRWSQKNAISAAQFFDVSVDNEQPYNVMGGTQDNGCWLGPSPDTQPATASSRPIGCTCRPATGFTLSATGGIPNIFTGKVSSAAPAARI